MLFRSEVLDVARGVAFGVEQLSDWTEQVGEEAGYPLRVEACDPMRGPEDMLAGGVLMGPLEADRRGGGGSGRGFGSGRNRGGGDASDVIGQFAAQATERIGPLAQEEFSAGCHSCCPLLRRCAYWPLAMGAGGVRSTLSDCGGHSPARIADTSAWSLRTSA